MKHILILLTTLFASINLFAQNCITERPNDLLFCETDLNYSVDLIQQNELDELITGIPSKSIKKVYIEESIRYLSDIADDARFFYEGDTANGTVDFYHPKDGYFEVLNVWMDNQEFTYVKWHDSDDMSYTLLFENPESYKLIYLQFEN